MAFLYSGFGVVWEDMKIGVESVMLPRYAVGRLSCLRQCFASACDGIGRRVSSANLRQTVQLRVAGSSFGWRIVF